MATAETQKFAAPIPAAVKAAAARAEKLQQDFIQPPKENEEEGNPPAEGEGNPPVEGQQEERPPAEEPAPPPVEPQAPADDDAKAWKHKFLSLQGRYDSDKKKSAEQLNALREEVSNLNRLIATIERPEPAAPAAPAKKLLTDEEIAEYGPEFVDMIERITKQATAPYEQEIASLKGQIKQFGGQIATGARAQLMVALEQAVPKWAEINTSQEFLDWLALPDAYSGAIRHELLKAAFGRNDSTRVINFFKGFLAETAATAPDEEEPGQRTPKTPLRNLAAPGRAKSTAAPQNAPAEKPIFTASDIAKFYSEKAMGKWRGREKEAQRFEADIFLAQQEGRIR